MGLSKKSQVSRGLDTDGKKWVNAGISIRGLLKPVKTKLTKQEIRREAGDGDEHYNGTEGATANMPEKLKCPPAPRKRRPALKCRNNVSIEYFVPPSDLETVFIRRL